MITINNLDYSYISKNINTIIENIIGLYLIIKQDNKNRAKITIKTVLQSIVKEDINVFNKYYKLFTETLDKIKQDNTMTKLELDNRQLAFNLLTQIKFIVDSDASDGILEKILSCGFSHIDKQNFYLFKIKNSDNFVTNITELEDIAQFKLFCHNTLINCCNNLLNAIQ